MKHSIFIGGFVALAIILAGVYTPVKSKWVTPMNGECRCKQNIDCVNTKGSCVYGLEYDCGETCQETAAQILQCKGGICKCYCPG